MVGGRILGCMSDADAVFQAFARRWKAAQPRRIYTPVGQADLREASGLPETRFRPALLRLVDEGFLAGRWSLHADESASDMMLQFTMLGIREAIRRGHVAIEDAPVVREM